MLPERKYDFKSGQKEITEGFKMYTHDSAYACIDSEKKDIFAINVERITRIKHDHGSILQFFGDLKDVKNGSIQHSFLYESCHKFLYDHRFFEFLNSQKIRSILNKGKLSDNKKDIIIYLLKILFKNPIFFCNLLLQRIFGFFSASMMPKMSWHKHHLCHAMPAYYFSPFYGLESLVLVLDGRGEEDYGALFLANNKDFQILSEAKIEYLNKGNYCSIGSLYSSFTMVLGYRCNSDEGKTEALAAYGVADQSLYDFCRNCYLINSETLTWDHNIPLLKKAHDLNFLKKEMDKIGRENFAATIQKFLENTIVDYLNAVYKKYPKKYLCLSGGTAANVIMNLHIYERTPFKNIYIFPAMGDDGTSFGPAIIEGLKRGNDLSWLHTKVMPYWGPEYTRNEVLRELNRWSDKISWHDQQETWPENAAKMVSEGKIIAIFQGKMEFGPRALGNRSIIADPRDSKVRDKMNLSIKRRPYFQPFCPSILESERERLFENSYPNKHMTIAFRFKKDVKDQLPSACHIDGTARPQFVEENDNPNYFRLLSEMKRLTGYGVVVNTSFNLHGRAMVMSPDQAIQDFLDCNLDALFIEGFFVKRLSDPQ